MKYIDFGHTREKLSELCLGTMMFGDRCSEAEADRIISRAIDAGINFIDTAAMYCDGLTEEIIGRIVKNRRNELFIATKVHKGTDRKSIMESIDESLVRLNTDHVDLFLIHWPKKGMNPVEIMESLDQTVQNGKARFVGCCNYPAWLFAHHNMIAQENGWSSLVCNQVPYNLIERGVEVEVLPQSQLKTIAITTYRPLSMGLLTGTYHPEKTIPQNSRAETDVRIINWLHRYSKGIIKLINFAGELHVSPAELAISWIRYSPAVTCPIVGVSSLNQLESCLKAFDLDLTRDQYLQITQFFDTEVKEESGGEYKRLRRELDLFDNK